MLLSLALCALMQAPAAKVQTRPLDEFSTNVASIHARVEFEYSVHLVEDTSLVKELRAYKSPQTPLPEALYRADGRWDCDGQTEYFLIRSVKHSDPKSKESFRPHEVLMDNAGFAFHTFSPRATVEIHSEPKPMIGMTGPIYFWAASPLHMLIQDDMPGVTPIVRNTMQGGRPTVTELYRRKLSSRTYSLLIAYDPAIGYLPRHVRAVTVDDKGEAYTKETYVLDAKPCASGGFIPTEWYEFYYPSQVTTKEPESEAFLPSRRYGVGHFRALSVVNQAGQVGMTKLDDIRFVTGPMNAIPFKKTKSSYSLAELRTLSRGSGGAAPKLANIDEEELRHFDKPPETGVNPLLIGLGSSILLIVIGVVVYRRRLGFKSRLATAALLVAALQGCGARPEALEAEIVLSAKVTPGFVLNERGDHDVPLMLELSNSGSRLVTVRAVSGGCSCRKVDQTPLPITLAPRATVRLPLLMEDKKFDLPQGVVFTEGTPVGVVSVPARIHILSGDRVMPESVSLGGLLETSRDEDSEEDSEMTFQVSHRQVVSKSQPFAESRLVAESSKTFQVTRLDQKTGNVVEANGYRYRDTTYQVRLLDGSLGDHQAFLRIEPTANGKKLEIPVSWKRAPFISTAPERVVLGDRRVRVFLRCPDDSVEFTKIVSSTDGLRATIRSPHEIEITPIDEKPSVLQGEVVAGTSSTSTPVIRIPVVRTQLTSREP